MEWIKLDKDNLPENEVLAANFEPQIYGYKEKLIGYLYYDDDEECICCEAENVMLKYCTHYIDINKFDI